MKRVGDVLSALFDEGLMKKAQSYSRLFSCWKEIAERHGIATVVGHSRITGLDRGVLWVEVDHPGWKQILQIKAGRMLDDLRSHFSDLDISGISIVLSRNGALPDEGVEAGGDSAESAVPAGEAFTPAPVDSAPHGNTNEIGYNAIKDASFRESLQRLEKSIAAN